MIAEQISSDLSIKEQKISDNTIPNKKLPPNIHNWHQSYIWYHEPGTKKTVNILLHSSRPKMLPIGPALLE